MSPENKTLITDQNGFHIIIKDERPDVDARGQNKWDVLLTPLTVGDEKRIRRVVVLEGDLENQIEALGYAAEAAKNDGNSIDVQEARLVRVDYKTALKWGVIGGMTIIEQNTGIVIEIGG